MLVDVARLEEIGVSTFDLSTKRSAGGSLRKGKDHVLIL